MQITEIIVSAGMAERWLGIQGYEAESYLVSDHGRVSRNRRLLKSRPSPNGYLGLRLSSGGVKRFFLVHRLVASAFIGPIPPGHEVNHKDADKTNNRADNLEIVTSKGNKRHAIAAGLMCRGERHGRAKMTAEQVRSARDTYRSGAATQRQLAEQCGVTKATMKDALRGTTWAHVI